MSFPNGQVPRSALVEVEPGVLLGKREARAYRRAVAAFKRAGKSLRGISGYRSLEVQDEMHRASTGDVALAKKWNLNPNSSVPVAAAGYSSHGFGSRIDLLFAGTASPSQASIALLGKYGWVREFGSRDPNHFEHVGARGTTPVTRAWCIRNGLYVGPK